MHAFRQAKTTSSGHAAERTAMHERQDVVVQAMMSRVSCEKRVWPVSESSTTEMCSS